jgi:hypothetical protein
LTRSQRSVSERKRHGGPEVGPRSVNAARVELGPRAPEAAGNVRAVQHGVDDRKTVRLAFGLRRVRCQCFEVIDAGQRHVGRVEEQPRRRHAQSIEGSPHPQGARIRHFALVVRLLGRGRHRVGTRRARPCHKDQKRRARDPRNPPRGHSSCEGAHRRDLNSGGTSETSFPSASARARFPSQRLRSTMLWGRKSLTCAGRRARSGAPAASAKREKRVSIRQGPQNSRVSRTHSPRRRRSPRPKPTNDHSRVCFGKDAASSTLDKRIQPKRPADERSFKRPRADSKAIPLTSVRWGVSDGQ